MLPLLDALLRSEAQGLGAGTGRDGRLLVAEPVSKHLQREAVLPSAEQLGAPTSLLGGEHMSYAAAWGGKTRVGHTVKDMRAIMAGSPRGASLMGACHSESLCRSNQVHPRDVR